MPPPPASRAWRHSCSGPRRPSASGAGAGMTGPAMPHLARANEAAVEALGTSRFEAEYEAGRRMGREAALRLALGESEQIDADAAADQIIGDRTAGEAGGRGGEI